MDGRRRGKREGGEGPVNKHQIGLDVENKRADAGRNGRTCLARPSSQARTGTGEKSFSLFS